MPMYHFTSTGSIELLTTKEASDKMTKISSQWEDEKTTYGKLYMGVYNWAYSNNNGNFELHIPKLNGGGEIEKNETASSFFGFDVFGDRFLEGNNEGTQHPL